MNPRKFQWLKQRLTGAKCDSGLLQKIVDFVMFEHPIDIEKLRKSLHYQVNEGVLQSNMDLKPVLKLSL